jgi:hypothetical protein
VQLPFAIQPASPPHQVQHEQHRENRHYHGRGRIHSVPFSGHSATGGSRAEPHSTPFVPTGTDAPSRLIAEFDRLQEQQVACVREADGLPLGRIKIISPFDVRVKYNLYACLTILPRHQHRHLWQAEQVRHTVR